MATVSEIDGQLTCSCGAKASPSDRNRFLKRHPALCGKRNAFQRGTVFGISAGLESQRTNPHSYRLNRIKENLRRLTDWEREFIADIEFKMDKGYLLSQSQKDTLEKIYVERTPNG